MDYLIKNSILLDKTHVWHQQKVDILMVDGVIKEVKPTIPYTNNEEIIDNTGGYISAGWVDLHTHCFDIDSPLKTEADRVGVQMGVTTLVDAGTSGCETIDYFFEQMSDKITCSKAFLNISKIGITVRTELVDIENIDVDGVINKCKQYKGEIIGIKVRESGSVVGENGIKPLQIAQKIAVALDLPIMVHIGNTPPSLLEILPILKAGDIITHIYNGKDNNIFQGDMRVHPSVYQAHQDGIIFDVGHGSESFDFEVAKQAIAQGIVADTISTDIYTENIGGPVHSLACVASKFLYLGLSLEDVIEKISKNPATIIGMEQQARIVQGKTKNLTLFRLDKGEISFEDSKGRQVIGNQLLHVSGCFIQGKYYKVGS